MLLEEYIIQKIRNIFMKNFLFQINTIRLNLGRFHFKLQNQNHKFLALTKRKDKFDINTFGKNTRFTDPKKSISYQIVLPVPRQYPMIVQRAGKEQDKQKTYIQSNIKRI